MAQSITTSLVVSFDPGDGEGSLSAEIDNRPEGYNQGETSFRPGDSPAFLVYKSSNVEIQDITLSHGSLIDLGSGTSEESEILTFANEREVSPAKPISGNFSSKWLGADGGVVTQRETTLLIPNKAVAVLKIDYESTYIAYRLSNVPDSLNGETEFSIVVYISGTYT